MEKEQDINYMTDEQKEMKWSIMGIWNAMLEGTRNEPKVRDYISPSSIGKNYWDRYQKMNGVPETNPVNDRVLRIFTAGDEFHSLMMNVFKASGIFINSQDENGEWSVIEETEKTMKLVGKYDVLAGGIPDIKGVEKHCKDRGFSEFVTSRTINVCKSLKEKYPKGLPKMIYDFKSINSQAFWAKKNYLTKAYPWHKYQLYAYLKANNIQEGRLLYISKDDLVTSEFPVKLNDKKLEKIVMKDLEEMSYYFRNKIEPPKPPSIVFNPKKKIRFQKNKKKYIIDGAYDKNWEVERSSYFQLMTGYKKIDDWISSIHKEISEKNNEIKQKFIHKNKLDLKEVIKK